jgi:hypothetical protein
MAYKYVEIKPVQCAHIPPLGIDKCLPQQGAVVPPEAEEKIADWRPTINYISAPCLQCGGNFKAVEQIPNNQGQTS